MLLHLLKKVVEYDKYEVCPRIDFPVPQFVLPILWLNFKRVFNLSIVAVSYLIPLWQLCQPMLIFAINFNPLEILERIALSRGADTFFPFDDGRFFGNINKGFPPSRLRARLTLAYKNWQEGSLNREGWPRWDWRIFRGDFTMFPKISASNIPLYTWYGPRFWNWAHIIILKSMCQYRQQKLNILSDCFK